MNPNLTDISIVLDRSNSMAQVLESTITGFNTFINEQKKVPGECLVSLVQFDHEYENLYSGRPVQEVPRLDSMTYVPRGNTALLGAIGRTIGETGRRLEKLKESERPGKVIIVVITDGEENASQSHEWSRPYSQTNIRHTISHQTERYQWQFVFIGANQDAITSAQDMGISRSNAINYTANDIGTHSVYAAMSDNVASFRVGASATMAWTEDQHEAQLKAKSKSSKTKETIK